ncbi:MAG: putative porin [Planctomycetota bacterium]
MMKRSVNFLCKLLFVTVMFGLFAPLPAQGQDDARIKKLEASVKALQAELDALKAERARAARKAPPIVDQKQLEQLVNKTFEDKKGEYGGAPDWVKKITPFGDFRYRYESVLDKDSSDEELGNERRRNRIRARLGFKAEINDEWDTIFRIATGSSDTATSTNQTLDDSFEEKDLWLDLGYAAWHPEGCPDLNVFMGKMKNPFYAVGKNQLIWDGDVNPEGGAASYEFVLDDATMATLVGGAFWLNERDTDADAGYFGVQGRLKHEFDGGNYLVCGVSFYDIGNIDSKTSAGSGVALLGNTPTTPGGVIYRYDYDLAEAFVEYGWKCNGMPVAVFSNYVENTAATNGNNTAYSVGCQLNKAKDPGSWQLKASYREVESDAAFAGLSDSDFIDGGTGGKGWAIGGKYQVAKNIQAGLTCFINDRDRRNSGGSGGNGSQNFERLQADLIFKF